MGNIALFGIQKKLQNKPIDFGFSLCRSGIFHFYEYSDAEYAECIDTDFYYNINLL